MAQHDDGMMDESLDLNHPVGANDGPPVPAREAEPEHKDSAEELHEPTEAISTSSLDAALRLQNGVGTWFEDGDTTAQEVGSPVSDDQTGQDQEPYAPLEDSGGEGIS